MRYFVALAVGALTLASLSQPTFAAPVTERINFSTTNRGYYGSINGSATVTFDPAATVSAGPTGAMVAISGLPGAYTGPWYVDYLPVTKQVSIGNFCGAGGCIAQADTNSVAFSYHIAPGGGLDTSFYPALLAYGVTDPLVSNIIYLSGLTLTVEQIATPSSQVPEPASLTLLSSGLAALGCSRNARRAALSLLR